MHILVTSTVNIAVTSTVNIAVASTVLLKCYSKPITTSWKDD